MKQLSNPFSSGEGGANFAARVAAIYMVALLRQKVAKGVDGSIQAIRFEARQLGVLLDDLLVTWTDGYSEHYLMLQIKHDLRFSAHNKLLNEVMTAAWGAFTGAADWKFRRGTDRLGIALAVVPPDVQRYLVPMLSRAQVCPDAKQFFDQEGKGGFSHKKCGKYLETIRAAVESATSGPIMDSDFFSFLQHLIILGFDLESDGSGDAAGARNDLLELMPGVGVTEARAAFSVLVARALELAPKAGTTDLLGLQIHLGRHSPAFRKQIDLMGGPVSDLQRLKAVFVPPRQYPQVRQMLERLRLVVISGPPHIGKSSLALYLADAFASDLNLRLAVVPSLADLYRFASTSGHVLLVDDAFDSINDERSAVDYVKAKGLSKANWIILTSRRNTLDAAQRRSRLGEDSSFAHHVVDLGEDDSYDRTSLLEILRKHLDAAGSDLAAPHERISQQEADLAWEHRLEIVHRLPFPHNIERFCWAHLSGVSSRDRLHSAIDSAADIERATRLWAERLELPQRWFVFLVALFPEVRPRTLNAIYRAASTHLSFAPDDVTHLVSVLGSYLHNAGQPSFRHPSYRAAVLDLMKHDYGVTIAAVVDTGLREVLLAEPLSLGRCAAADYGWPRYGPGEPVPVQEYLAPLSEAYNLIRNRLFSNVRRQIAPYSNGNTCTLFVGAERAAKGTLLIVPVDQTGATYQAEVPVDISERIEEIFQVFQKVRVPIAAHVLDITDLAHRSPQMHALSLVRAEVQTAIQKRRLKEAWPLAHARVEKSLCYLGGPSFSIDLHVDPEEKLDTSSFRTVCERFESIAAGDAPRGLADGAWERILLDYSRHIVAIQGALTILERHGRAYTGPLLPDSDRQGRTWVGSWYSAERMKEILEKAFAYCIESYQWMVENNFPEIAGRMRLYRALPVKVLAAVAYGNDDYTERGMFYLLPRSFPTATGGFYEVYVRAEHEWTETEPPPLPNEAEGRLQAAEATDWIQKFWRSATDFCDASTLVEIVYDWIESDVNAALDWGELGAERSSHYVGRPVAFLTGNNNSSPVWDLSHSFDPREAFDWP